MNVSFLKSSHFSFFVVAACVVFFSYMHRWNGEDGNGWEATVDGDSKGNYAYLPALFIYHDLSFNFYDQAENSAIKRYYHPRFKVRTSVDSYVNKNYCGVAVLLTPFFVAGHGIAWLTGEMQSGYSWPYMFTLIAAAIFYLLAGLYYLRKLLSSYQIQDSTIALIIAGIAIGTNLFYYTAVHSTMAHVYSFFVISVFAYHIRMYCLNSTIRNLYLAALFLGLITIIRPLNLMIVFAIPFLAGSWPDLKQALVKIFRPQVFLVSLLLFVLVISVQLGLFKLQTGSYFVWSYGNEGFNFSNPHILQSLFSFRKGWLVYTPVMLMIIPGIYFFFKRSIYEGISFTCVLLICIYIISSWWSWYFGDGFGLRAYIDFYAVFIIPVALMVQTITNRLVKFWIYTFLILCIVLNLIQTYQYRYNIIHPDAMNFEKYKYVFLQTGSDFRNVLGGKPELLYFELEETPALRYKLLNTSSEPLWTSAFSVNQASEIMFNSDTEYGPALSLNFEAISDADYYVKIQLSRKEKETGACDGTFLVFTIEDSAGNTLFWNGEKINELPSEEINEWRKRKFGFSVPADFQADSRIKIFVWNKNKTLFSIKEMEVEFYKINKPEN